MFFKKRRAAAPRDFDREALEPVLRCSICTGEQAAGFRDKKTGKFQEVRLIRSPQELEEFLEEYGLEDIRREY